MSYKIPPPETFTPLLGQSIDPQAQLIDALRALLLHHGGKFLHPETSSIHDLPSIYLVESQYVSGETSAAKSCMHLNLLVSPDEVDHAGAITLTLELNVRTRKC